MELYLIVWEVAMLACRPGRDPRRVTEAAWDAAKAASRWPDAPDAKEMCVQLADPSGVPWPWRVLLREVFSGKSLERMHTARMSAADDPLVDSERTYYAVRRVAAFRGQETIGPHEYAAGRKAMIAEHRRKWKHVSALERLLPTLNQLMTVAQGDWTLVLEWAELAPPPMNERRRKSRPYVEAIIDFWQETGVAPRHRWLAEYAHDKGFSLGRLRGKHLELVEEARALGRSRGLGEIPSPDRQAKRPLWTKEPGRREGEAVPQERVTSVRAVTALREFHAHCTGQKPKRHPARRYYAELQMDRQGPFRHWPSAASIDRRGPWTEQIHAATQPDALERAAVEDLVFAQAHDQRRREQYGQHLRYLREGDPDEPRAQRILELLREQSPRTRKELQREVGGAQPTVSRALHALVKAGLVRKVGGGRSTAFVAASEDDQPVDGTTLVDDSPVR